MDQSGNSSVKDDLIQDVKGFEASAELSIVLVEGRIPAAKQEEVTNR